MKLKQKNPYDNITRYATAQWIFVEEFGKSVDHAWKFKSVMFGNKDLTTLSDSEWNRLLRVLRAEYNNLKKKAGKCL